MISSKELRTSKPIKFIDELVGLLKKHQAALTSLNMEGMYLYINNELTCKIKGTIDGNNEINIEMLEWTTVEMPVSRDEKLI